MRRRRSSGTRREGRGAPASRRQGRRRGGTDRALCGAGTRGDTPWPVDYRRSATAFLLAAALAGGAARGEGVRDPVADAVSTVSPERLAAHVARLAGFGTRHALSAGSGEGRGIDAAEAWVAARFAEIPGVEVERRRVRAFRLSGGARRVAAGWPVSSPAARFLFGLAGMGFGYREPAMSNVIARLPGREPERLILLSAHLDSRPGKRFDWRTDAPGANDDGSGVAGLLEAARALAPLPRRASVWFVAFNGEELGLLGSRQLAREIERAGLRVEAMLNLDTIGGTTTARDLPADPALPPPGTLLRVFSEGRPQHRWLDPSPRRRLAAGPSEADSPSRQLARYVRAAARRYVPDLQVELIARADRIRRGGDHFPFLRRGVAAVRFTEQREDYAHEHQDPHVENGRRYGDLPEFVDPEYMAKVTRIAVATAALLARAPRAPEEVRIDTSHLGETTTVRWRPSADPEIASYRLLARRTASPDWEIERDAGTAGEVTVALPRDDWWFAVQAVAKDGTPSLPSLAWPSDR
ncbi:MAG: M20/M25/M40 family metallo-hydrolase [Acidobacteria bacterium]|nr:MAG: M20/M25/M40 family metallo-hydrolase [Acidobacteriota bacterium]